MSKQSSIEQKVFKSSLDLLLYYLPSAIRGQFKEQIEQAKAMHKEDMANTWIKACEDILSAIENDTVASFSSEELFEQYYNETFGGR